MNLLQVIEGISTKMDQLGEGGLSAIEGISTKIESARRRGIISY